MTTPQASEYARLRAKLRVRADQEERFGSRVVANDMRDVLALIDASRAPAEHGGEKPEPTEKQRRIYYQEIAYGVCCSIDRINRSHGIMGEVRAGETDTIGTSHVQTGTVEHPNDEVRRAMRVIEKRIDRYRSERDEIAQEVERCHKMIDRCLRFTDDGTTSVETLEDRLKQLLEHRQQPVMTVPARDIRALPLPPASRKGASDGTVDDRTDQVHRT